MTIAIAIPTALKAEHDELHAALAALTEAPGRVGEAAREVARLLHSHFVKEEEYALPPLGLLDPLARGTVTEEMQAVLPLTDRLKKELPEMLGQHRTVVGALERLVEAARAEQHAGAARFADALRLHAEMEEQVLYPAAILVGEYVRLGLGRRPMPEPAVRPREHLIAPFLRRIGLTAFHIPTPAGRPARR